MKKEIIYTEEPYQIIRYQGIPPEAINFLDEIAWGSEGALYEHKNTAEHIHHIFQPSLFAILEHGKIQGTAIFCNSPVTLDGQKFDCFYIRYFASSKEIRGKGVMKNLSIKVMDLLSQSVQEKTILYACIERQNKSSYKVVEAAGYSPSGKVKTMGFSRFFPKKSKRIQQVKNAKEQAHIIKLLQKQYKKHALVQFNSLFLKDDYYYIKEGDEIVAGCQFHKAHWVVNRMKGLMGKIVMNIVPLLPILNKVFNPKRFEFLGLEGIYVKEGHEKTLFELFEGLLVQENLRSAMFWMGDDCPIRQRIETHGKLGFIHSFVKDSDVIIMANYQNMSPEEIELVKKQPIFAAAFDYI